MYATDKRNPMIGLGVTTAMAAVMLSGCAGNSGAHAEVSSASQSQHAQSTAEANRAIEAAEVAVAADPRNAAYRMQLGNAYLDAGRFASASTSFEDAMALGDNSPRAALSLALSMTGQARYAEAASVLNDWQGEIAASDLGLAYALAGQPERGIHILSNAIRGGDNTVKTRQNLAYAYAVAGRWREARMMVAQDVPAHEVGSRMTEWAQMTHADAYQARVAGLLGVPANIRDGGQPQHLALNNTPSATQLAYSSAPASTNGELAAIDSQRVSIPARGSALPAVGAPEAGLDTYAAPKSSFSDSFASNAGMSVTTDTARFADAGIVAPVPVAASETAAPRAAARSSAVQTPAIAQPQLAVTSVESQPVDNPTHLVQLGSFSSEAGARRAWDIYVSRYPELANRELVITQAVVRGRNYWRVSAAGYDRASSRAMCGRVDAANGDGCISWAEGRPLPGAIETGVRLARR